MNQPEDAYYIKAALKGDTKAFAIIVDRYKHMVFTLAMKMVRNREEAEEVAQDVFFKVYRVLSTFKGDAKFSTWLYKIAYHRSLDYIKKQKRTLNTSAIDVNDHYNLPDIAYKLDYLEVNERKQTIKDAIDALPEDDAVVITLHYFEELSLKEIAEIMNITPNTVKVRLFRSRKRLAVLLKNKLESEILDNYGRK